MYRKLACFSNLSDDDYRLRSGLFEHGEEVVFSSFMVCMRFKSKSDFKFFFVIFLLNKFGIGTNVGKKFRRFLRIECIRW